MIENGDLLRLSSEVIKPFYKEKSLRAVELLQEAIADPRFRLHKPEGAIFLWLWFDELHHTSVDNFIALWRLHPTVGGENPERRNDRA